MEQVKFIKATQNDIEILVDYRIAFSNDLAGKQQPEVEEILRTNLRTYFQSEINKAYLCWYATVNGEVAAIAGLGIRLAPGNVKNPSGKWGYIMSVYTVPQHRKKGLCTALLDKLVASAGELGITAFELHATKEGEPIYQRNGFVLHNEPTYRKFILPA